MLIPCRKELKYTNCTLDGKNKNSTFGGSGNHWFIVLTSEQYNKKSLTFLGIPLSSLKSGVEDEDYYRLHYGVDISNDDIEGERVLNEEKNTVVLCDRPCRVEKADIEDKKEDYYLDVPKIAREKYNEIVKCVQNFIQFGKKDAE